MSTVPPGGIEHCIFDGVQARRSVYVAPDPTAVLPLLQSCDAFHWPGKLRREGRQVRTVGRLGRRSSCFWVAARPSRGAGRAEKATFFGVDHHRRTPALVWHPLSVVLPC